MIKYVLSFVFLLPTLAVQAQVDFTADIVCQGNMTTLTGSSSLNDTSITSWKWDLNGDGTYDDATGKSLTYTFPAADSFQVGLMINVESGADDSVVNPVIVNPVPEVTAQVDNVCQGQKNSLAAQTRLEGGVVNQYKWDFNGDGTYDQVTDDSVTHFFYGPAGTYAVKVLVQSGQGCAGTDQSSVKVYSQPSAHFKAEQNKKAGTAVTFDNQSSVAEGALQHYLWYFGDGHSAVTQGGATHTFDSAGTYSTKLIAVTTSLCRDTAQTTVTVDTADTDEKGTGIGGKTVANSHIMTPNGDGINDRLILETVTNGQQCEVVIFNRWNQVLYQSEPYQNDWDGTRHNGQPLKAGAYFYRLQCADSVRMGTINILKSTP